MVIYLYVLSLLFQKWKYIFYAISFLASSFPFLIFSYHQDLPNPLFQAILREMKEEDFVDTPEEGMKRVLGGQYAFMEWELFYDLNYGSECRAFALPASYFPSYGSVALPKGSPLVPVLNTMWVDGEYKVL